MNFYDLRAGKVYSNAIRRENDFIAIFLESKNKRLFKGYLFLVDKESMIVSNITINEDMWINRFRFYAFYSTKTNDKNLIHALFTRKVIVANL